MATGGRVRSTRKLRSWIVEQVSSGRYPGLVWDDPAKTMFRIPWKHAGKQDFRSDEDAAIFKAWSEFKGKLTDEGRADPASWKTRLRVALNKSCEFREVSERSQLDISEPYKVYRLVPLSEQGMVENKKKTGEGKRKRSQCGREDKAIKELKEEEAAVQPIISSVQQVGDDDNSPQTEQSDSVIVLKNADCQPCLIITLYYLGHEVLKREIFGNDVRIAHFPSSHGTTGSLGLVGIERIALPKPPPSLFTGRKEQAFASLLPYMEKGVMLASTKLGIYAKRFCQARVFWTGPHTSESGPHKLECTDHPVMLFSRQAFQQELAVFSQSGGAPPRCGVTLCFGEELSDTDDLSSKLITVQISLPWAMQTIQQAQSVQNSLAIIQDLTSQSPLGEVTLNLVSLQ
ncbi:interferon regulatory factor 9 isoform X2 [Paramormyrops kingsleyae]|uniref:interferon regulatory factor 9 isoform X2 n=1 Tax=Paramormyrops kingsleyae TaxID=1676925 RepID=UPI000CD62201|nr:interferon regulatory factor 9-like isoform X2 [Paramormyrops kingsleyae]